MSARPAAVSPVARTLRERVEALGLFECRREAKHGPPCAGAGPGQRPCLRESAVKCDPCARVFQLGAEIGVLEQTEAGRLLDGIREVLWRGAMCPACMRAFRECLCVFLEGPR